MAQSSLKMAKNTSIFFVNKTKLGGGRGGFVKDQTFYAFFLRTLFLLSFSTLRHHFFQFQSIIKPAMYSVGMQQCIEMVELKMSNEGAKRHLKAKGEEKSNKCDQCDFASSFAGNLKEHLKIHSGEKSNKCAEGNYATNHTNNLRKHLKIHSGEKSNVCDQCNYASSEAGSLRTHL